MTVYIFYTKNTPAERDIQHLKRELDRLHVKNQLVDADSRQGAELAGVYDVLARPATVLVRDDDGSVIERWDELPTAQDVSYRYVAR